MKILVFNWRDINNPRWGGATVYIHEIFKRLSNKGYKITFISSGFKGCKKREIIDGIEVIRVGGEFTYYFAAPLYYIRFLKNENYDVIVEDISKVPICTPAYTSGPSIAIIYHIHGNTLVQELPLPFAIYVYLSEIIPLRMFYKNIPFITISKSTKEELVRNGLLADKISTIYSGINPEEYHEGAKSSLPLIVYFGRIKKYKRIDHILKAFQLVNKKIPEAQLMIAGKGDDLDLMGISKKLKIDKSVKIEHEISEKRKIEILQNAWTYIIASMKEGWGLTVIEANACGTPAIAYDVPGLRDSIKHGYNGLLVKNGDVEALAEAIKKVLVDQELRERLSKNALEWAKQFSWDKSAEEFEKVLRGICYARFGKNVY